MCKTYIIIFLIAVLSLAGAGNVLAQEDTLPASKANIGVQIPDSVKNDTAITKVADTTKTLNTINKPPKAKVKIVKDTAHYALYKRIFVEKDSIIVQKWLYNPDMYDLEPAPYDSTLDGLHLYNPAYRNGKINSYLGQVGEAIQSHQFFDPNPPTRFIFLQSFTPYMHQGATEEFYNVKKPFTLFGFDTGAKDEQDVTLVHTQNVTQNLNLFFKFNSYTGLGQYTYQETKNNSGSLGGSFIKGRYATHGAWTFSRVNVQENGGVIAPSFITDSSSSISSSEIGTRLTNAKTFIKDRQFFFDQKIGFIKAKESDTANIGGYWFSLQYRFDRQYSRKYYEDDSTGYKNPITDQYLHVYKNNYSGRNTFDSCSYSDQQHLIRLNLEEVKNPYAPFGLYGALGYQKANYYYFNIDTLFDNSRKHRIENGFIEAGLHRMRPGLLRFMANYRQYLAGYRLGDFSLQGKIIQSFSHDSLATYIMVGGILEQCKPDYFLNNYRSNHFKWQQDFGNRPLTTQVNFEFAVPKFKTGMGGHYSLLTNYIYFNQDALPEQTDKTFLVFDAWLNNRLSFKGINLVSRINYQYSDNKKALPLPELSAYEALFYERRIHFESTDGWMKFQLGVDMFYWTKYDAPAYCPATALFYNQNETTTGNYPFIGAFANVEIKRLRFFIRLNHVDYNMLDNNYFLSPNYPSGKRVLNYGIRWTFYD